MMEEIRVIEPEVLRKAWPLLKRRALGFPPPLYFDEWANEIREVTYTSARIRYLTVTLDGMMYVGQGEWKMLHAEERREV